MPLTHFEPYLATTSAATANKAEDGGVVLKIAASATSYSILAQSFT